MHPIFSSKFSPSKFVPTVIVLGLWLGVGAGCARHGQTSISWMWKSTPATFSNTVADWLPLMSHDRESESTENQNAKVTANSAEVSLDPFGTSTDLSAAENNTGVATLTEPRSASRFPWNLDRHWHDAAAPPATDPFLESDVTSETTADAQVANTADVGPIDENLDRKVDPERLGFEALPAPDDEPESLISSIEDGTRGADSIQTSADISEEDSALVRLRDLLAEEETTDELESVSKSNAGLATNDLTEETDGSRFDQETKFIRQRVESLLEAANERLSLGNLDDAHRLCQQAQSLARSSPVPLKLGVSPVELLREIENRQTDAAIQLAKTRKKRETDQRPAIGRLHDVSDDGVAALTGRSVSSDNLQRLVAERTADSSIASIEQDLPRKYSRRSTATVSNTAEQWDVDADEAALLTAKGSGNSKDRTSSSGAGPSARLIANGSAHLHDNQISPTSLTVPIEEPPSAESLTSPSFHPPEWSRWDADDELSDDHAIEHSSNRDREMEGTQNAENPFALAGTSTHATRLSDISWDDEKAENSTSASDDDTQWKLMIGLLCLLIGLSAASLLRHSRRNVPVAMPVDPRLSSAP